MIKQLFQPDLLLVITNGKTGDYVDFFANMYDRQQTFNLAFQDVDYIGSYTPSRNSGYLKTRSFPAVGTNWIEFQNWLDTAYTLAKPVNFLQAQFNLGNISTNDAQYFAKDMGLYRRPKTGGFFGGTVITTMTASNGTVLGTGLLTDIAWENAYNNILIPYERSINSLVAPTLSYIKNIQQYGDWATFFRTCSFRFDGTGY